jgi:NCS1 family nucleobase:cation symporter-1
MTIHPKKLRPLFTVKLIIVPICALATMGWCVHKAGGAGPVFSQHAKLQGSNRAWAFLSAMSSVSGGLSTLALNIPDFSRYAKSSKGQWVQLPFIPTIYVLAASVGIIGTSATAVIYGELIWNPLNIYINWIQEGSSGGRAAAFFCGFAWMVSQICVNITANSISAANDLTVLFPRYVNIKRGSIIAATIGAWVFVPWRIVATSTNFLTFMGGYSIFLAPMAGIMCADFWIVKKQKIDLRALYDPHGRYRYWYGINWRALLAFLVAFVPNFPGLIYAVAGSTGQKSIHISSGAQHIYKFNWLYGVLSGAFVYTVLSLIFPDEGATSGDVIDSPMSDGSISDDEKRAGVVVDEKQARD